VIYRGTSLIRNSPPPVGPPQDSRYSPDVGSWEEGVSYERDTSVLSPNSALRMALNSMLVSSDTMNSFISFRKSAPAQNRQLDILISNNEQYFEFFWRDLTF
jgi:hypothetical protein